VLCYRCGTQNDEGEQTCIGCGLPLEESAAAARPAGPGNGTGAPLPPDEVLPPGSGRIGIGEGEALPFVVGDKISDRYDVKEIVGRGPHGAVLKVFDTEIEVDVALKVLDSGVVAGPEDQERVLAALRKARQLNHPNVVRIFDADVASGRIIYTMQYLEGLTLRRILQNRWEKRQVFTLLEAEPIVSQLCLAMQHAHRVGPHGLLKPENVAVLPDVIKVMDFGLGAGLAAPTLTTRAMEMGAGGELYFPPEVRAGAAPDTRADVFALGVILGELLSGERYRGDGEFDLLALNPALPPAIAEVVERAIAADPANRYATAPDLAADLASVIDTGKVRAARGESGAVSMDAPPAPAPGPAVADSAATAMRARRERTEKTMEVSADMIEPPDGGPQVEPGEGLFDGASEGPTGPIATAALGASPTGTDPAMSTFEKVQQQARQTLGGPTEDFLGAAIKESRAKPPPGQRTDSQTALPATVAAATPAPAKAQPQASSTPSKTMIPVRQADGSVVHVPLATLAQMAQKQQKGGGALVGLVVGLVVLLLAVVGVGGWFVWQLLEERTKPRVVDTRRVDDRDDHAIATSDRTAKPDARDTARTDRDDHTGEPASAEAKTGEAETSGAKSAEPVTAEAATARAPATARDVKDTKTARDAKDTKTARDAKDTKTAKDAGAPKTAEPKDTKDTADEAPDTAVVAAAGGSTGTKCPGGMALVKSKKGNYCIDRFEYPGTKGAVPKTSVGYAEAKETCEKDGKRLCSAGEWTSACTGKGGSKFPYGPTFDPDKCVTDDDEGDDRPVMATGSMGTCKSAVGAFDMSGNVEEWVYGNIKMGGGGNKGEDLASCTNRAKGGATKYTGFRCCADAGK